MKYKEFAIEEMGLNINGEPFYIVGLPTNEIWCDTYKSVEQAKLAIDSTIAPFLLKNQ